MDLLATIPALLAQAATGSAAQQDTAAAMQVQSVWDFIVKGGPMMIPIGLISLFALAVVIERALSLRRRKVIPSDFISGLEPILKNRKALYENYASVIGDFNIFCELMDALTTDYTCLYIHNAIQTNRWQDCVFYYKADPPPDNFRFGCREFWKHHHDRFDPDHVNNFDDFDED